MRSVPLAALALLACPLLAQAPLVERIEVTIVNVDVTVTGAKGDPVRGLTRDDFELFEDGEPQPITNFYVVEDKSGQARAAVSNEGDERFRRKVLLLIDTDTTTPFERNQALEHLEALINDRFRGGEYDWSIAALDTELRVLLPPTSDKDAIHRALDQIRANRAPSLRFEPGENPSTPLEAFARRTFDIEKLDVDARRMDGLLEAFRSFGAGNGKKVILLLAGSILPNDWNMSDLALAKEIARIRNRLIEEANASNVNLYIVNPEGISGGDPSMYWLARQTGGRLFPGNRVDQSLQQFDTRSSNFYSLGYRPKHPDDGKYHRIVVRLKNGGRYALQYRNGYVSLPDAQQIERTLSTSFGAFLMSASAIPVNVSFGTPRNSEFGGLIVPMKTTVPAEQLAFLSSGDAKLSRVDIFISVFDASGRSQWHVRLTRDANLQKTDAVAGTFNETTEIYLQKGKPYRIVVAVRDQASEAVGVTQQVVQF